MGWDFAKWHYGSELGSENFFQDFFSRKLSLPQAMRHHHRGHKMHIIWVWLCCGQCHISVGVKIPFQWWHMTKVIQLFPITAAIWYGSGSLWLNRLLLQLCLEQLMVTNVENPVRQLSRVLREQSPSSNPVLCYTALGSWTTCHCVVSHHLIAQHAGTPTSCN